MFMTFIGHFRVPGEKHLFAPETAPVEAYSGKGVGILKTKNMTLLKKNHPGPKQHPNQISGHKTVVMQILMQCKSSWAAESQG